MNDGPWVTVGTKVLPAHIDGTPKRFDEVDAELLEVERETRLAIWSYLEAVTQDEKAVRLGWLKTCADLQLKKMVEVRAVEEATNGR